MTNKKRTRHNNSDNSISANNIENVNTSGNSDDFECVNKIFARIAIALFMCVLILPTVSWYSFKFLGKYNKNIEKLTTANLDEKRELANLKGLKPGNITVKLENYYNDHVPFRGKIMTLNNKLTATIEKPYDDTVLRFLSNTFYSDRKIELVNDDNNGSLDTLFSTATNSSKNDNTSNTCSHNYVVIETSKANYKTAGHTLYECKECGDRYYGDYQNKKIDNSFFPEVIFNNNTIKGRYNWLFYTGDNSIDYYRAKTMMTEEDMSQIADRIEYLKNICESKGKKLQLMIMPNKEQVYWEYMPTYTIDNNPKRVSTFVDYLKATKNIDIVYPINELKDAKKNWQVYYKSDTHWNSAGAFIGLQALYKALELPMTDLTKLDVKKATIGSGDLVSLGGLDSSSYNKDVTYDIPYKRNVKVLKEEGDRYMSGSLFLETDSKNKCNFVMISDSFRIAMIPFFEKDFSNVTTTHRDHIADPEIMSAIRDSDILVLAAVERFDTSLYTAVDQAIYILES